jgi:cytoskeletal protein RodZ
MEELGPVLKQAREAKGISLREVAERTKISVTALEALERSDISRLPGGIFGRSFVRSYASEIGLDPETVVRLYLDHLGKLEQEAALRGAARPEITKDDLAFLERQRRAVRLLRLVVAAVIIAGIAGGVAWRYRAKRVAAARVAAASTQPEPAPVPVDSAPPDSSTSNSAGPAGAAAPDTTTPANTSAAAAPAALAVDVRVTSDSWVFISADGTRVVSSMFHAGESKHAEAAKSIVLDIGDAGAVQWTLNGTPAKSLGRAGSHATVTITPDTIAQFTR